MTMRHRRRRLNFLFFLSRDAGRDPLPFPFRQTGFSDGECTPPSKQNTRRAFVSVVTARASSRPQLQRIVSTLHRLPRHGIATASTASTPNLPLLNHVTTPFPLFPSPNYNVIESPFLSPFFSSLPHRNASFSFPSFLFRPSPRYASTFPSTISVRIKSLPLRSLPRNVPPPPFEPLLPARAAHHIGEL